MQPKVMDVNALVADMVKMLGRMVGEDVDLVTNLDSALGRVKSDPGQIEQVIINLAVNAKDAMPSGGKLIVETSNVVMDEAIFNSRALLPDTIMICWDAVYGSG